MPVPKAKAQKVGPKWAPDRKGSMTILPYYNESIEPVYKTVIVLEVERQTPKEMMLYKVPPTCVDNDLVSGQGSPGSFNFRLCC